MIAMSIEQSRYLLELWLDPKTADMWWSNRFVYWKSTPMIGISTEQHQLYTFKWCDEDVPAWSLTALLEAMPSEESKWCTLMHAQDFYWCTFEKSDGTILKEFCSNNYTDAAYEMVCWLLEHRLIEKEEQDGQ